MNDQFLELGHVLHKNHIVFLNYLFTSDEYHCVDFDQLLVLFWLM